MTQEDRRLLEYADRLEKLSNEIRETDGSVAFLRLFAITIGNAIGRGDPSKENIAQCLMVVEDIITRAAFMAGGIKASGNDN